MDNTSVATAASGEANVIAPQNGRIGVVTVTYNSASVLEGFLCSLKAQTYRDFITYAIDNASTDVTLEMLRAFQTPWLRVIANISNLGVAAGNNQGISAALDDGCEYVLLINNDTEFPADLLEGLEASLRRHGTGMVVPKIYFHNEPNRIWCAGGRFSFSSAIVRHTGEGETDSRQYERARSITYAPTCCMLIHKSVFERVGLMDEKYFVYFDDTDFCLRVVRSGIVFYYEPSVHLTHKVSSLTGGANSPFSVRFGTRNKTYFIGKHFGARLLWLALLAHEAGWLFRALTGRESWETYRIRQTSVRDGLRMLREHFDSLSNPAPSTSSPAS